MENVDVYSNVVGRRVEKPNIHLMLVGKQTHTCIRRILVEKQTHRTRLFGKQVRTTQFCGKIKAKQYIFVGKRTHANVCVFAY